MRKLILAVTAVISIQSAVAQQPLQCLNPGLVNGLVFLGRSDLKVNVSRGLPSFMSGFQLPSGFSLIGTGVRDRGITTVAYKTPLTTDKAYAAVLASLGAEGWGIEPDSGVATFRVAGGPQEATVCRDAERRGVAAMESGDVTYVSIIAFPATDGRSCNAPPGLGMGPDAGPRFQFPDGTSLAQGGFGGGGSNRVFTTSTRIISEATPANIVEHLAGQLVDQGWRRDSGWSGNASAGSTWNRVDGLALTSGTLAITRVSDGTYDVDFTRLTP